MEIIIVVAVLVGIALWWGNHVKTEKSKIDSDLDNWTPPKAEDKPWPYGEKVAEGKIHVKSSDVAPGKSAEDRVETPAPKCGCGRSSTGFCVGLHKLTAEEWAVSDQNPNRASAAEVTAENKQKAVAKAKKAPAKKPAAKPAVAKKAPANKKSV